MRRYENECVGCPPERGCLGTSCPNRRVLHIYCDACKDESDDIYEYDGKDLCRSCLMEALIEDGVIEEVTKE